MSKAKWIMKQYWRVGTIRALLSLVLGMFVLGKQYYVHIPYLEPLGLLGALILGTILVLIFLGLGWAYDEKGKFWSPQNQAITERTPYQYVPSYKNLAFDYPAIYAFLASLRKTFEKRNLNTFELDEMILYLDRWFRLKENRTDIFGAENLAKQLSTYRFNEDIHTKKKGVSIGAKLKLGFQIEILRLNWIQALTGLFQDVLVFAALYVTIIFPDVATDGLVPINYLMIGILFLSMPLYLGLTAAGWYYDKKLQIWSVDYVVKIERNPYAYVPDPRTSIVEIPFFLALFRSLNSVFENMDLDNSKLEKIIEYLETYKIYSASKDEQMAEARELRKDLDINLWS